MAEMKDVGTDIYRLRYNVCPPQLAVSTVYVVTTSPTATANFLKLYFCGCTCVCVCVGLCVYAYIYYM